MDYDAYDALLHHIFKQTQGDAWFKPSEENVHAGVCLRVANNHFRVFPYENRHLEPFEAAVRVLNPVVAVKVRSAAIHAALGSVKEDANAIFVDHDTRIQILDTMSWLPRADKEQCGAFIRDERVLVVWSYDLDDIIPTCRDFEDKMIKLVWAQRTRLTSLSSPSSPSMMSSGSEVGLGIGADPGVASTNASGVGFNLDRGAGGEDLNEKDASAPGSSNTGAGTGGITIIDEKETAARVSQKVESSKRHSSSTAANNKSRGCRFPLLSYFVAKQEDAGKASGAGGADGDGGESGEGGGAGKRQQRLLAPLYAGVAFGLSIFFVGSGTAILIEEAVLDGNFTRFALLVTAPPLICISLFFCLQMFGNLTMIIGPVAQYHQNSKYYSAVKPAPNSAVDANLPHITIEMPVYKESLKETIAPSVYSIKKAMQTYARQGGTSTIFVHDDGLQLISEDEREARIAFYADNNIGWVARPPHSSAPDGYKRAGRFKKASNMNYGLLLSLKLERHLATLIAEAAARGEEVDEDDEVEERALELAVEETFQESGGRWRPWARNARSLRVGEIILIIDSDTIVPEDCFRDAARELAGSPEVAIIQHESDVMQVAHHYFENGIAHFTRRINKCISLGCANGEVAPFVGHNAFLRWSALQDAAFVDEADGVTKIWSESNVSEDFDMALRLQLQGYSIRWATYSDGGFKEGVSLTCDDELNRWQKYSYGCNELIFYPLVQWWRKGPINKQLRVFVWSDAPVHYKISMMSYMFSYYGIAAGCALSLMNYLLLGWTVDVDGFFLHSFEIWLACTVVFPIAGNIGFTLLEYRLGHRPLLDSFWENISWIPFFFFFFGGLSIHLSQALLAHMFSYNITWGATKKEVERSNFWLEIPKILKRFWLSLVICFVLAIVMVVFSTTLVPSAWQIPGWNWAVIFPLALVVGCHILFPIVLNPWLMVFSY